MIRFAAKANGMVTLKDYSLRLVGQGSTTADEVIRVTISETGGEDTLCKRCKNPIGDDFIKCPFCQFELKVSCTRCGTLQEEHWQSCAKCGLTKDEASQDSRCKCCDAEVFGNWVRCPYCQAVRDLSNNGSSTSAHPGPSTVPAVVSAGSLPEQSM